MSFQLDSLLTIASEEVALEGEYGCNLARLWALIGDRQWRAQPSLQRHSLTAAHSTSNASSSTPTHTPQFKALDQYLRALLWKYLVQTRDIEFVFVHELLPGAPFINEDTSPSQKPKKVKKPKPVFSTVQYRIVPGPGRPELQTLSLEQVQERYGDRLRLKTAEATRNRVLFGSDASNKSISPALVAVVSLIAKSRDRGITQVDLGRETGIDPRSIFHHIKVTLQQKLCVKFPVVSKGLSTNMCLHVRFVTQSRAYQDWIHAQTGIAAVNSPSIGPDPSDEPGFQTELVKYKLTEMLMNAKNQILRMDEVRSLLTTTFNVQAPTGRWFTRMTDSLARSGYIDRVTVTKKCRQDPDSGNQSRRERKVKCLQGIRIFEPVGSAQRSLYMSKRNQTGAQEEILGPGGFLVDVPLEQQVANLLELAGAQGMTQAGMAKSLSACHGRYIYRFLERAVRSKDAGAGAPGICRVTEYIGRERRYRYYSGRFFDQLPENVRGVATRAKLDGGEASAPQRFETTVAPIPAKPKAKTSASKGKKKTFVVDDEEEDAGEMTESEDEEDLDMTDSESEIDAPSSSSIKGKSPRPTQGGNETKEHQVSEDEGQVNQTINTTPTITRSGRKVKPLARNLVDVTESLLAADTDTPSPKSTVRIRSENEEDDEDDLPESEAIKMRGLRMTKAPSSVTVMSLIAAEESTEVDPDDEVVCSVCLKSEEDATKLAVCAGCKNATHPRCLNPPLASVPDGPLYCSNVCEAGEATPALNTAVNIADADNEMENATSTAVAGIIADSTPARSNKEVSTSSDKLGYLVSTPLPPRASTPITTTLGSTVKTTIIPFRAVVISPPSSNSTAPPPQQKLPHLVSSTSVTPRRNGIITKADRADVLSQILADHHVLEHSTASGIYEAKFRERAGQFTVDRKTFEKLVEDMEKSEQLVKYIVHIPTATGASATKTLLLRPTLNPNHDSVVAFIDQLRERTFLQGGGKPLKPYRHIDADLDQIERLDVEQRAPRRRRVLTPRTARPKADTTSQNSAVVADETKELPDPSADTRSLIAMALKYGYIPPKMSRARLLHEFLLDMLLKPEPERMHPSSNSSPYKDDGNFSTVSFFTDATVGLYLKLFGHNYASSELETFMKVDGWEDVKIQQAPRDLHGTIFHPKSKWRPQLKGLLEILIALGILEEPSNDEAVGRTNYLHHSYKLLHKAPLRAYAQEPPALISWVYIDSKAVFRKFWMHLEYYSLSKDDTIPATPQPTENVPIPRPEALSLITRTASWNVKYTYTPVQKEFLDNMCDRETGLTPLNNEEKCRETALILGTSLLRVKYYFSRLEYAHQARVLRKDARDEQKRLSRLRGIPAQKLGSTALYEGERPGENQVAFKPKRLRKKGRQKLTGESQLPLFPLQNILPQYNVYSPVASTYLSDRSHSPVGQINSVLELPIFKQPNPFLPMPPPSLMPSTLSQKRKADDLQSETSQPMLPMRKFVVAGQEIYLPFDASKTRRKSGVGDECESNPRSPGPHPTTEGDTIQPKTRSKRHMWTTAMDIKLLALSTIVSWHADRSSSKIKEWPKYDSIFDNEIPLDSLKRRLNNMQKTVPSLPEKQSIMSKMWDGVVRFCKDGQGGLNLWGDDDDFGAFDVQPLVDFLVDCYENDVLDLGATFTITDLPADVSILSTYFEIKPLGPLAENWRAVVEDLEDKTSRGKQVVLKKRGLSAGLSASDLFDVTESMDGDASETRQVDLAKSVLKMIYMTPADEYDADQACVIVESFDETVVEAAMNELHSERAIVKRGESDLKTGKAGSMSDEVMKVIQAARFPENLVEQALRFDEELNEAMLKHAQFKLSPAVDAGSMAAFLDLLASQSIMVHAEPVEPFAEANALFPPNPDEEDTVYLNYDIYVSAKCSLDRTSEAATNGEDLCDGPSILMAGSRKRVMKSSNDKKSKKSRVDSARLQSGDAAVDLIDSCQCDEELRKLMKSLYVATTNGTENGCTFQTLAQRHPQSSRDQLLKALSQLGQIVLQTPVAPLVALVGFREARYVSYHNLAPWTICTTVIEAESTNTCAMGPDTFLQSSSARRGVIRKAEDRHLASDFVPTRLWYNVNGKRMDTVLGGCLKSVMLNVAWHPGISESALAKKLSNALTRVELLDVLILLEERGGVKSKSVVLNPAPTLCEDSDTRDLSARVVTYYYPEPHWYTYVTVES
ncbi:hypothetical protein SeMB42_g05498 [Synchytrium endobioticum]|uniref:Zinc finger PHD-type domain-containing protein n=1 Tax=Synchytrium endobioticum TaxID=286115 RepID=A0A507CR35_9FUNG|nr:hypothetical protein SeMB42_g05498 [Synchytrium endobioticum]